MINLKRRFLRYSSVALLAAVGILCSVVFPALAAGSITAFTISPVGTATAGDTSAQYDVSFSESGTGTSNVITVSFPSGYSIQNGIIGNTSGGTLASAIQNSDVVHGESSPAVVKVEGNSASRSITITLDNFYDLNGGTVTFRLLKGITNPSTPGLSVGANSFLISTLPSGASLVNTNSFQIAYNDYLNINAPSSVKAGDPFTVDVCSSNSSFSGTITLSPSSLPTNGRLRTSDGTEVTGDLTASASGDGCATFSLIYTAKSTGTTDSAFTFNATAANQQPASPVSVTNGLAENGIISLSLTNGDSSVSLVSDGVRVNSPTPINVTPGAPVTLTMVRNIPAGIGASSTNWKTTGYRFNTDATKFGTTAFCIDATAQAFHLESLGNNDYRLTYLITNTPISPTGIRALQLQTYTGSGTSCGSWSSSPAGSRLAWDSAVNVTDTVAVDDASASDDTYSVNMNTAYTLAHTSSVLNTALSSLPSVLDNDSQVADIGPRTAAQVHDGDALPNNLNSETFQYDTNPSHASSFTLNADGSFTYTPAAGYSGTDTFTYHVSYTRTNGQQGYSNRATVTIQVNGASIKELSLANTSTGTVALASDWTNQHSSSGDGSYPTITIAPGGTVNLSVTVNTLGDLGSAWNSVGYRFATPGGSNNGVGSSYSCIARSGHTVDNGGGVYTLTFPITNTPISPAGIRAFYVRLFSGSECNGITDGALVSNNASAWSGTGGPNIYYRAVNVDPNVSQEDDSVSIGAPDSFSTSHDSSMSGNNVLSNDNTNLVASAQAINFTSPSHGSLSSTSADGSFTYTPDTHYVGSDSFTYQLQWTRTNGQTGTTDPITVSISVYNGGGGSSDDAFYISSCQDLQNINSTGLGKYYELTQDIDCTYDTQNPSGALYNAGAGFARIGDNDTPFTGTLNGDGHVITGLKINRPDTSIIGLFGQTNGATITKVGLVNVSITGGYAFVGGFAGYLAGGSTLDQSFITGSVSNSGGGQFVGGIVGFNDGSISNSYSLASVTGANDVGGITGYSNGPITNSYAAGSVSGTSPIGGITNDGVGSASSSFYDSQTTGQSTGMGTAKTTSQMKTLSTFAVAGWNFAGENPVWGINNQDPESNNNGYPFLRWQNYTNNYTGRDVVGLSLTQGEGSVDLFNSERTALAILPGSAVTLHLTAEVTGSADWQSTAYRFNSNSNLGTTYFCVARTEGNTVDNENGTYTLTYSITNTPINPTGVRYFQVRTYASNNCDANLPGVTEWTGNGGPAVYANAVNIVAGESDSGTPTVVASSDSYSFSMNNDETETAEGGVMANDTVPVDVTATAVLYGDGPAHGSFQLNTDGSFTYTPTTGFHGNDSFQYRLAWTRTNGQTGYSEPATVNFTVNGYSIESVKLYNPSDAEAVLANGGTNLHASSGSSYEDTISLAPGATANLELKISVTGDVSNYWNSIGYRFAQTGGSNNGVGTSFSCVARPEDLTPTEDGVYTLNYSITNTPISPAGVRNFYLRVFSDGCPGSNGALVSNQSARWTGNGGPQIYYKAVNVTTESAPNQGDPTLVPQADGYFGAKDITLSGNVMNNDTYTSSTPGLQAEIVGDGVSHGMLNFNTDGSFTYTPDLGFIGVDHFQYRLDWTRTNGQSASTDPVNVDLNIEGLTLDRVTLSRGDSANVVLFSDGSNTHANANDGQAYEDTLNIAPGAPLTLTVRVRVQGDIDDYLQSIGYRFNRSDNLGSNNGIGKSFTYVAVDHVDDENGYNTTPIGSDEGPQIYALTYTITNTPITPEGLRNFYLKLFPSTFEANTGDVVNPSGATNGLSVAWTTTNGAPTVYWQAINTTNAPNSGLLAVDDSGYSVAVNGTLNTVTSELPSVLSNDAPPSATAELVEQTPVDGVTVGTTTKGGSITLNTDGSFTYVPLADFHGIDTFQYELHYTKINGQSEISAPATVTIIVGTTVENADFDFSVYNPVSGSTSTALSVPQAITLYASSSVGTVTVAIPTSTDMTANSTTWNGIISLTPINSNVSVTPDSGQDATIVSAIDLGLPDTAMTFSQAIRISFPGQAGKYVGWSRNGSFTAITSVCGDDSLSWANSNLASDGDCKISTGGDLVVWTKHFTTFIVYSQSPTYVPATPAQSGGGGGGGGSYSAPTVPVVVNNPPVVVTTTTPVVVAPVQPVVTPPDQLACSANVYLTQAIKYGTKNNPNDVKLLEKFLNTYEGTNLPVDGVYSKADFNAVVAWQEKYAADVLKPWGLTKGTGYVYTESLKKIKQIVTAACAASTPAAPAAPAVSTGTSAVFNVDLSVGSTSSDVKRLQQYLNANGFPVAKTGVGSPGKETTYFGSATLRAVIAYQKAHNITPLSGLVGPKTRAAMAAGL